MTSQEKRIINNILTSNHLAKKLAKSALDKLDKSGVKFDMTNKRDALIMKCLIDTSQVFKHLFVDDFDKILQRANSQKQGQEADNEKV